MRPAGTSATVTAALSVAVALLLGGVAPAGAVVEPTSPPLPDFDVREATKPAPAQQRELARLAGELGPRSFADLEPRTGGLAFLGTTGGYLAEPGDGRRATALDYVTDRRRAFGLDREDVAALVPATAATSHGGVRHLTWTQRDRGIDSYDTYLKANLTADGELINLSGAPAADFRLPSAEPRIGAERALAIAAAEVDAAGRDPRASAELTGFVTESGTRLAWRTQVRDANSYLYEVVVDAGSGRALARRSLTRFANQALVYDNHPDQTETPLTVDLGADATWINRSDSGTKLRGNNAHAYSELGTAGIQPAEEVGQVGGDWSFPFSFFTQTGCPAFGCTWDHDPMGSDTTTNADASTTNLFYLVNRFHDHLLAPPIGFDEASGNFEHVNSSGEGVGGDAMTAEAGFSAGNTDQAFFAGDGVDGNDAGSFFLLGRFFGGYEVNLADAADVVYHEYTHGLTARLLSPGVLGAYQSVAMGEGWSDWFALDLLVADGELADTAAPAEVFLGAYLNDGSPPSNRPGIRAQAIDCPVGADAACPAPNAAAGAGGLTYGDLGKVIGAPEVHADGEIWAQTLWDLRDEVGVENARALVSGGIRLAPSSPGFLDMRDAILQSARAQELPTAPIWEVFAGRGMGFGAADGGGSNATAASDDFTVPDPLMHAGSSFSDPAPLGDDDGYADAGETLRVRATLENTADDVIAGAAAMMSSPTPGVAVGDADAGWPSIAAGAAAPNDPPFAATIPQSQGCGSAVRFDFEGTAPSPAPSFEPLGLTVGSPVFTASADPALPVAIPDPGTVESVHSELAPGTVSDLDLRIDRLDHTAVGDLELTLTHGATTITLMSRPGPGAFGAFGDDFDDLVLDDEAVEPIATLPQQSPPSGYSGRFRPDEALSAFDGDPAAGEWTLELTDAGGGDAGTLHAWALSPALDCAGAGGPGTTPPDTTAPDTKILSGPKRTKKPKAKFRFEADEAGASFECRLKGRRAKKRLRRFDACEPPRRYRKLKPGRYKFAVRAIDAAGNVDPTPAKRKLKVLSRRR